MKRRPIIIGNWKMNLSCEDARRLLIEIRQGLDLIKNEEIDIVICPTFLQIPLLKVLFRGNIKLGAQDVFWEEKGAFTGEISCQQLKEFGCSYVILGHSERRNNLGETDEMVAKKVKAATSNSLFPIICLGESAKERKEGQTEKKILSQLESFLNKLSVQEVKKIIIAYEPIWAIGTGQACAAKDAQTCALLIRQVIGKKFGEDIAKRIRIVYGGSVSPQNIEGFVSVSEIDGALVGSESLSANSFVNIIRRSI